MTTFQMPLRLNTELATKIRMIAASNNTPMNTYITKVLADHVTQWESEVGILPMPPQEER
jgi:predicted HicB family RNase H-like nuclease